MKFYAVVRVRLQQPFVYGVLQALLKPHRQSIHSRMRVITCLIFFALLRMEDGGVHLFQHGPVEVG